MSESKSFGFSQIGASKAGLSQLEQAFEKKQSRYVVGIDLGTTNCAVAFMDSHEATPTIELFRVEQMVDFQTSQRADTLPSFHYELSSQEASQLDARFQFVDGKHKSVVGVFARQRGMQMPGRCIASAKSWLCHPLVDRTSDLLPWSNDEDVKLLSPVEASRRYLEHIRRMWDREHPTGLLADQEVIVTLPASFDEVARQLTLQAAKDAGLSNVVLIEEPQAAFYAWLFRNQDNWTETMRPGQTILVCDIGGGTTDFTLIRVVETNQSTTPNETELNPSKTIASDASVQVSESLQATYGLHRVAVGEHLMLGGDNLDLALAKAMEQRLLAETPGMDQLKPRQWDALKSHCRVAKETLLGSSPPDTYWLSLPGSGSKLIENSRSIAIDYKWARSLLVDGFFGQVELNDRPDLAESGFQEFGLPFAADPNANRHLAKFLWEHRWAGRNDKDQSEWTDVAAARPDWILFNGGVLESSQVKTAILNQIRYWFGNSHVSSHAGGKAEPWKLGVLEGNRLDLAVAQGAAYFGLVRRGHGVRIDARLARAYYLLVDDSPARAICVMPANASPMDRFRLDDHPFELVVGQPVQFPIYQSSTNLVHQAGQLVLVDHQTMTEMTSIRTVLEAENRKLRTTLPVVIESELTEIGTLAMQLRQVTNHNNDAATLEGSRKSWTLELDVRSTTAPRQGAGDLQGPMVATVQSNLIEMAVAKMEVAFGEHSNVSPKNFVAFLSDEIGQGRREWNPAMLREMWRFLIDNQDYRKRSPEHEARFINLLGWCLRPGFGMTADDWRVNMTWRTIHGKLNHRSVANASEAIVLWRRIAGGFTPGQQQALFQDCWPRVRATLEGGTSNQAVNTNMAIELLRLVGALEWISLSDKKNVANALLAAIKKKKLEHLRGAMLWTLGRMGCRRPVYATLQQVVPASVVQGWIEKLLSLEDAVFVDCLEPMSLCMMQLAVKTHDRYRDHSSSLRDRVVHRLEEAGAPKTHIDLISSGGKLDDSMEESILGDSLPLGFRLRA